MPFIAEKKFRDYLRHNWPVKALSIIVAVVIFSFYRITSLEQKTYMLPITVMLPSSFAMVNQTPSVARVTVKGSHDALLTLTPDRFNVYVDLSGVKAAGAVSAPIKIKQEGASTDHLSASVDPGSAKVEFDVKISKSVPVVPNFSGELMQGYAIGEAVVNPAQIIVEGPRGRVNALSSISTEPIELSGRRSRFSVKTRASHDALLELLSGDEVTVSVGVKESLLAGEVEEAPVTVIELDKRFTVVGSLSCTVNLTGSPLVMDAFDKKSLRLTASASDIRETGTYRLEVKAEVPPGVSVTSIFPAVVEVKVEERSDEGGDVRRDANAPDLVDRKTPPAASTQTTGSGESMGINNVYE